MLVRPFFLRPHRQARQQFTLAVLVLLFVQPILADVSAPQEQPKAKLMSDITTSSGAYTRSVEIKVPDFHGIEPKLALQYNSSAQNGFVGAGWALTGLSFIERASPGGGAPRYDATDIYLLDGAELVPNCSAVGGTHCSKHQTYQRIVFDAAIGKWTVTDKDGTKSVYTPRYTVAGGTFRWAIESETDTDNNTVTYNYWCESGANCYPDTITYNGATITFYRESRPSTDEISFANGNTAGVTSYRLRSIGVKVSANYARAYALGYYESGTTKRSLLQTVQTYGTDVVIDAGAITGGTSLPAITFTYTGSAATSSPTISTTANNPWANLSACISGDYNQDGNSSDIACYMGGANNNEWHVWLSSPNGWVWGDYRYLVTGTSTTDISTKCLGGDFNRDGMSDVACYAGSGSWRVGVSTGGTATTTATWTVQTWTGGPTTDGYLVRDRCFVGDYNGDGRSDLACHNAGAWRVGLSSGSGWSNPNTLWTGPSVSSTIPVTNRCFAADFNGDGKTDLSCQTGTQTGLWSTYLVNATGTNFSSAGNWAGPAPGLPVTNQCLTADLNGDGKSEIACYTGANGAWHNTLSTGNGFTGVWWTGGVAPTGTVSERCAAGDINGDGRTDITCLINGSTGAWATSRSVGNGWDAVMNWTGLGGGISTVRAFCIPGDYNGDGLADFACRETGWKAYYPLGELGHPDLLKTVQNGIGGKETVTYAPSSRWANYNTSASWLPLYDVPVGMVLPTVKNVELKDNYMVVEATAYRYENAKWSYNLKQFVGFARMDAHSSDGACHVSLFSQTDASPGALKEHVIYANVSSTVPLHKNTRSYIETQAPPYTSLVDEVEEREYKDQNIYRANKKKHLYDAYGNLEKFYNYGDTAIGVDDSTVHTVYYPNSTAYVVDKPGLVRVYAGIGTGGTVLSETLYHYDNNTYYYNQPTQGRLTKLSVWDDQRGSRSADTSVAYSNTVYGHDNYGNVTSTTDPEGHVTTVTYNDPLNTTYNNVYPFKTCRDPSGLNHCAHTKWDLRLGLPLEVTDPNNALTKTGYDPLGRKTSHTDPANNVTTWSYQNIGNPNSQRVREIRPDGSPADSWTGVGGYWTDTYMDGFGRPYFVEKEAGEGYLWDEGLQEYVLYVTTYAQRTIYKYGSNNPWKQSTWHYGGANPVYTVFDRDILDRPAAVTHPGGGTVTYSYEYDNADKPYTKKIGEMGQETKTWYDTEGRVVKVEQKDGADTYATTFQYDLLGRRVKVVDAMGNEMNTTYDSIGRKLTESRAGGATWTYTYYKDDRVHTEKDAKNQTTTFTYDAIGRLKTQVVGGQTSTWNYDEAGRGASIGQLTTIAYPGGSKEYTYNTRGLITLHRTCVDTVCKNLTVDYDGIERPTTFTYPDGDIVTYAYRTDGNLYSVSGYVSDMYWNPAGRLLSMTHTNGTASTYTYDDNRGWLKTATTKKGVITRYTATYDYDGSGRVTLMMQGTPVPVTTKYTYDPLDRVKTIKDANDVVIQSYSYNGIGNITNNSQIGNYTYGDAGHKHAVTAAGASNSYTYDANGSMLTSPGTTFVWDMRNRLGSVTRNGVTTSFGYNEAEQRVKKTTGGVSTRYFSEFIEATGSTNTQYYYADSILVGEKIGTTKYWYHGDHLGSTRLMTNNLGDEAKEYDYKAFGADSASGSAPNERGFTGHITDGETGLIYMGARYYAATLSRFISADSMVAYPDEPQDLNRYSYVHNSPLIHTDPTGHQAEAFDSMVNGMSREAAGDVLEFIADMLGVRVVERAIVHPSVRNIAEAVGSVATLPFAGVKATATAAGRAAGQIPFAARFVAGFQAGRKAAGRAPLEGAQLDRLTSITRTVDKVLNDLPPYNLRTKRGRSLAQRAFLNRMESQYDAGDRDVRRARALKRSGRKLDKYGHDVTFYLGRAAQHFANTEALGFASAGIGTKYSNDARFIQEMVHASHRCETALKGYHRRGGRVRRVSC